MTEISPLQTVLNENIARVNDHVRVDDFYSQTIPENNTRLDGVTSWADLRDELKLIEALLLARVRNRAP